MEIKCNQTGIKSYLYIEGVKIFIRRCFTENNENQQKETKRNTGGIIAAGVIIILLAAVWIWIKKKAEKKTVQETK